MTDWQMAASALCSRESSSAITHHFLPMVMHGSGSAGLDDSMDGAYSSSSPGKALNLFCTCKSWDGAGALLLVLETTSFQPSATTGIFSLVCTDCLLLSWDISLLKLQSLAEIPVKLLLPLTLHNMLTSYHISFSWWHTSSTCISASG